MWSLFLLQDLDSEDIDCNSALIVVLFCLEFDRWSSELLLCGKQQQEHSSEVSVEAVFGMKSEWRNVHFLLNDPMNIKEPINRTQTGRVVWWLESSQSHMCNLICVIQRTFERERLFVTVREHSHVFMQERRLPVYNNIISDKCTSAHIKSVILRSHERRVKKGWKWAEDQLDEERTRYRRKKKRWMNSSMELVNSQRGQIQQEIPHLCSPRLHIFDQKYCKNSDILLQFKITIFYVNVI